MAVRVSQLVVCACVAVLPVAIGLSAPWRDALTAGVLLAVLTALSVRARTVRFCPNPMAFVCLIALAVAALQCLPMPKALLAILSPGAADIYAVTLPERQWLPLSLDVPTTAHWLVKLVALYAAAVTAPVLFGAREERKWLIGSAAIGGVALLVACVATASVFAGSSPLRGPINNPNHVATLLGFASLLAAAGWMRQDEPRWLLYAIACIACGSGVFLTLSRGGVMSYAFAAVSVIVVWYRASSKPILIGVVFAIVAVALLCMATWILRSETAWAANEMDKSQLWPVVVGMITDFPWLGLGRGAFVTVFTRYNVFPVDLTFTHAENEYLQAIADFGVPAAVVMLGLLAFQLLSIVRGARGRTTVVLIIAILFVASRELVDFGSSRLAISLPCVLLMSALAGDGRRRGKLPWFHSVPQLAGLASVLVLSSVYAIRCELTRDTRALAQLPYDAQLAARAILDRHPADFVIRSARAVKGLQAKTLDRAFWHDLNAALYLAPMHATPHRVAGQALFTTQHHDQALVEYRTAARLDATKAPQIVQELVRLGASDDQLEQLAAEPAAREAVAIHFLQRGQAKRVLAVLGQVTEASSAVTMELTARSALALGDARRALELAAKIVNRAPTYHAGYELEVLGRRALGDENGAQAALVRGLARVPSSRALTLLAFQRALEQGRVEEARGIAQLYLTRAVSSEDMAQAHVWIAKSYEHEGNLSKAIREITRASELHPNDAMVRVTAVRMLVAAGDVIGARRELAVARKLLGNTSDLDTLEALVSGATR